MCMYSIYSGLMSKHNKYKERQTIPGFFKKKIFELLFSLPDCRFWFIKMAYDVPFTIAK